MIRKMLINRYSFKIIGTIIHLIYMRPSKIKIMGKAKEIKKKVIKVVKFKSKIK
jgi:hypothetical protein